MKLLGKRLASCLGAVVFPVFIFFTATIFNRGWASSSASGDITINYSSDAIGYDNPKIIFENEAIFKGNESSENGVAVRLFGNSTMFFREAATFDSNESIGGCGYATRANNSLYLAFGREIFEDNGPMKSCCSDDIGYDASFLQSSSSPFFGETATFGVYENIEDWGAAAYANNSLDLAFGREISKNNDPMKSCCSDDIGYDASFLQSSSSPFFGEAATFVSSENTGGLGGAVYIRDSARLTFEKKVIFKNNRSLISYYGENNNGGGAIFSEGNSVLVFRETTIFDNNESIEGSGGAIYARGLSSLTFEKETIFKNNKASNTFGGGSAIFLAENGVILFRGATTFDGNESDESSNGAVYTKDSASLFFEKEVTFKNNKASYILVGDGGGAIYSRGNSTLLFKGAATFNSNESKGSWGGALFAKDSANLIFEKEVAFKNNRSLKSYYNEDNNGGGAIFSEGKSVFLFRGAATFNSNESREGHGGAIYAGDSVRLAFEKETIFKNNRSLRSYYSGNNSSGGGGAIFSDGRNVLAFSGAATFDGNESREGSGGAILARDSSNLFFGKEVIFKNNKASNILGGGAIFLENYVSISFMGTTTFDSNESMAGFGGAVFARCLARLTFEKETVFKNNRSTHFLNGGGAIFLADSSIIIFRGTTIFDNNESNGNSGGAIFTMNSSSIIFEGETIFKNNKSSSTFGGGGAIFLTDIGNLLFKGAATFDSNESIAGFGGAIFTRDSSNIIFDKEVILKNNKTLKDYYSKDNSGGGAIFSEGNSFLNFRGAATFDSNESLKGLGAAVCARDSARLIFEGETIFKNNKTLNVTGGAGAISLADNSILLFKGKTTFDGNASEASGGTIRTDGLSKIVFEKEAIFRNNKTNYRDGGAIISRNNSVLAFRGATTFKNNESESGFGGAIYAEGSSKLTFEKEVLFKNNKSMIDGGAILSRGNNIFLFKKEVTFEENESNLNSGGAIFAENSSNITFEKEVTFKNNRARMHGGAVTLQGNSALFFREAVTFEDNKSNWKGSAIFVNTSEVLSFNSGLRLINNNALSTYEPSGAIHMLGENDICRTRVDIVQKDPTRPTVFKGNKSADGYVAVYMEKYSTLNFFMVKGNVDLYDSIEGNGHYDITEGDRIRNSNTVTIEGYEGWFNLKENGSINNVNLINHGGNLNLLETQAISRPLSFRNSGKIVFGIFPEGNICNRIQAEDIILEDNTTIEIATILGGVYKAGSSYDIMVSENPIRKSGNINIAIPQNFTQGLRARAIIEDKFFRILIEANGEDNFENWLN
ncbi:MAG: hypothetical protein LBP39_02655 [Rickettsiales bacterium]|jgi:predicted outer membrane repeat protein|nr:hypothetical protein [Rickettsiales bacterium]